MSHCYSAIWLTLILLLHLFTGCRSRCYDECDKYRPEGSSSAYVLNCSAVTTSKMELRSCANCLRCPEEICREKTEEDKQLLYCPEDSEGLSIAAMIGISIAVIIAIAILYFCLTRMDFSKIKCSRICRRRGRVAPARGQRQQPLLTGRPTSVATSGSKAGTGRGAPAGGSVHKGEGANKGGGRFGKGKAYVAPKQKTSYRPDGF